MSIQISNWQPMLPDFKGFSCQWCDHDSLCQLGIGRSLILVLEVPVEHGKILILELRDLWSVAHLNLISWEKDDVSKKKDLDLVHSGMVSRWVAWIHRPGADLERELSMSLLNVQAGCPRRREDLMDDINLITCSWMYLYIKWTTVYLGIH